MTEWGGGVVEEGYRGGVRIPGKAGEEAEVTNFGAEGFGKISIERS